MSYITNIDTLSALLDRLISENIKLHFFKKDGIDENIEHQEKVISAIKDRLFVLFDEYSLDMLALANLPVELKSFYNYCRYNY